MLDPIFTEGVCGDGAAILKDGQPMTIPEILAALNEAEARKMALETIAVRLQHRIDAATESNRETVGIGLPFARQIVGTINADLSGLFTSLSTPSSIGRAGDV